MTGASLGKNAMLAFRILTSSGKIYLEYVVNKVRGGMTWKPWEKRIGWREVPILYVVFVLSVLGNG
jgi:hypothetical protein